MAYELALASLAHLDGDQKPRQVREHNVPDLEGGGTSLSMFRSSRHCWNYTTWSSDPNRWAGSSGP